MANIVKVKVSGELACFTRPEAKVERVSYMCMTPSAARGVLEAVLWKPEFHWIVHSITVLRPIRFISIRRNEVQDTIPVNATRGVLKWMEWPDNYEPYYADSAGRESPYGDHRVQRHTLALREVAYLISAEPELTDRANQPRRKPRDVDEPQGADTVEKYVGMFTRRVAKGQCFQQAYLGLREFVAEVKPMTSEDRPDPADPVLSCAEYPLGRVFYDFQYGSDGRRIPLFAPALLRCGVLDVDAMRENLTAGSTNGIKP